MSVTIVDFRPQYAASFRDLNYEWISTYFNIEETDRQVLQDPQGAIIDHGGSILIALLDDQPVGTCALLKNSESTYELGKMAVSPAAQGRQIGYKLGLAIIARARSLNAKTVFLETNSSLKPAIGLYRKLGFHEASGTDSCYSRCNIQMELKL